MIRFVGNGGHARAIRGCARWFHTGTIIAIGSNRLRRNNVTEGTRYGVVIAKSAIVASDAQIGEGTVILEGAIVQAGCIIGRHVIINAGAVITHDCTIEDFAHIAPGAHLCGGVYVGEGALIGTGVAIEPLVRIPAWAIVKRPPYEITLRNHPAV